MCKVLVLVVPRGSRGCCNSLQDADTVVLTCKCVLVLKTSVSLLTSHISAQICHIYEHFFNTV